VRGKILRLNLKDVTCICDGFSFKMNQSKHIFLIINLFFTKDIFDINESWEKIAIHFVV